MIEEVVTAFFLGTRWLGEAVFVVFFYRLTLTPRLFERGQGVEQTLDLRLGQKNHLRPLPLSEIRQVWLDEIALGDRPAQQIEKFGDNRVGHVVAREQLAQCREVGEPCAKEPLVRQPPAAVGESA